MQKPSSRRIFYDVMNSISKNNWNLNEELAKELLNCLDYHAKKIQESFSKFRMLEVDDIKQELFVTCMNSIRNKKFISRDILCKFTTTKIVRKYIKSIFFYGKEEEKALVVSLDDENFPELPSVKEIIDDPEEMTIFESDIYNELCRYYEEYQVSAWFLLKIKKWPTKAVRKLYSKYSNFNTFTTKYMPKITKKAESIVQREIYGDADH